MKRISYILLAVWLATACDDGGEKKAGLKLEAARHALEAGRYNEAKLEVDSIKILYPKAFEARKEGIKLMQQIDLKEQRQSLAYLDSMLQARQTEFEKMKDRYVLEKDAEYQQIGNYFAPSQTVEKNINRSFLRAQVSEDGIMTLTSIYCGPSSLHHTAVKVTAPDGSFAQTPPSKDSYESTDLGVKTEKADYKLGNDGDVIGFIVLNQDKNLKVEYLGDRKYHSSVPVADRQAITSVYELSQVLSAIEQIKKEMKEANLKIEFITRKIKEGNEPSL